MISDKKTFPQVYKILLMSDTHGNNKFLRKSIKNEDDVNAIIHLGDSYEDLLYNEDMLDDKEIFYVPGFFDSGYIPNTVEHVKLINIMGWKFLMCHSLEECIEERKNADVIFHGHTHRASIFQKDDQYIINPGHLKNVYDRGNQASYAVIEVFEDIIKIHWKELEGKEISFSEIRKKTESA